LAIHDSAQFVPHEVHVPLTPLYLGSQYNSSSVPQDGQLPTPYSLELLCDSHLFTLEKNLSIVTLMLATFIILAKVAV